MKRADDGTDSISMEIDVVVFIIGVNWGWVCTCYRNCIKIKIAKTNNMLNIYELFE